MKRKNPYPGVSRAPDRHGKVRWRLRWKGGSCYLPGAWGSEEFRNAYEAALAGKPVSAGSQAPRGTLRWVAQRYMKSAQFADLAPSTRCVLRQELDWLCGVSGQYQVADLRVRHVEAIMAKKDGPAAANKVRKNLRKLINYGMKKELLPGVTINPAWQADPRKEAEGGFHTWTEAEIERYRKRHPTGTMARLAMELARNTGASRQDLAKLGRQNITASGKIEFRRGKTGIVAVLPILPELAAELAHVPADQMVFLVTGAGRSFTPAYLGNWFRDRANEAGVPGSIHGLRKAGATALANDGASPDEIRAFLAHKTNKEGSTYTGKADRERLAERAFQRGQSGAGVSNLPIGLDRKVAKDE